MATELLTPTTEYPDPLLQEAHDFMAAAEGVDRLPEEDRPARGFTVSNYVHAKHPDATDAELAVHADNLAGYLVTVYKQRQQHQEHVKALAQMQREQADAYERGEVERDEAEMSKLEMTLQIYASDFHPDSERTIRLPQGELARRAGGEAIKLADVDRQHFIDWLAVNDVEEYDRLVKTMLNVNLVELKKCLAKGSEGRVVWKPSGEYFEVQDRDESGAPGLLQQLAYVEQRPDTFSVKPA